LGTREGLRLFAAIELELNQARRWMQSPRVAMGRLVKAHSQFEELIASGNLDHARCLHVLCELSSLQIDAASTAEDLDQIRLGMAWAQAVLDDESAAAEDKDSAAFNIANGLTEIHYISWTKHRALPVTNASLK
jgi:hypothetical protein